LIEIEKQKIELYVFFKKDGDLGGYANAKHCYMKQKHRLIWERRHGPVGSGMKSDQAVTDE
jgi:NADH dehydrogenase (ubiquinone) 1 beta subcomplex subunit 10